VSVACSGRHKINGLHRNINDTNIKSHSKIFNINNSVLTTLKTMNQLIWKQHRLAGSDKEEQGNESDSDNNEAAQQGEEEQEQVDLTSEEFDLFNECGQPQKYSMK
jgi:cobalamin biosynthesis protein CobT